MRRPAVHRMALLVAGGVLAVVLAGLAAIGGSSGRAAVKRASMCETGRVVASGSPPSTREQEKVLDVAYKGMLRNQSGPACLDIAESRDVVDYGIGRLWRRGIDGAGTTIALSEGWDDPFIEKQVAESDRYSGLPNPQIRTIYPSGDHRLPARCPSSGFDDTCGADVAELYTDVLAAHAVAPYAKILIVVTPADSEVHEDFANQGGPEMMQGVEAVSRRHLANVISISYGSGESIYRYGHDEVTAQDPAELTAAGAGIPVLNATGDCGPVAPIADATQPCAPHTGREISTWADSPWVLAVGGSIPSASGSRVTPGRETESAGISSIFARPAYQNGVASITHSSGRSVPDITMDNGAGTSGSAPLMAGVLALATQANGGHDLGPISTALYDTLGPRGAADGIIDITRGNNTLLSTKTRKVLVRGYAAHKGFDLVSGWGTISAPRFVPALVAATRASQGARAVRAQAAAQLAALRRAITITPAAATGSETSQLTATGFPPRFPVVLSIDGHRVATLHADDHGDVDDTIDPARLHLATGTHTVTLTSILITVTGRLTTR